MAIHIKDAVVKIIFPEPTLLDLALTKFFGWVFISFSYSLVPVQMSLWVGTLLPLP